MKIFLLTLCLTAAAFAAPPNFQRVPANGNIWDFQSSVLDDFEANLRRMRDEFDQLEKSLESRFKFPNIEHSGFPSIDIDGTGVRIFENGTNIFDIDPSNVKNKTVSDTKIVDDKVVHTEEKVIANGNSVVHFRTVQITPKDVPSVVVHSSSNDDDDQPPKTPSSSVPEVTPSKNDVDSEHVDNDDNSYHPSRDVEEIDNVEPLELRVVPEVAENDLYGSDSNEHRSSVVDLSGDTKVNDILSEKIASGALLQPEPDAEIIEFDTNNINNNNRFANDNVAQKPAAINDNNRFYYHYEVDP